MCFGTKCQLGHCDSVSVQACLCKRVCAGCLCIFNDIGWILLIKFWVTLPQLAGPVLKMCSPVVGVMHSAPPSFSCECSSKVQLIQSLVDDSHQSPSLCRHTRTHIHTYIWTHTPRCLAGGVFYEVSAVSASQRTCEMISYSPASLLALTLPFSVFLSGCALSRSVIHHFLVLGYLFNKNATFSFVMNL